MSSTYELAPLAEDITYDDPEIVALSAALLQEGVKRNEVDTAFLYTGNSVRLPHDTERERVPHMDVGEELRTEGFRVFATIDVPSQPLPPTLTARQAAPEAAAAVSERIALLQGPAGVHVAKVSPNRPWEVLPDDLQPSQPAEEDHPYYAAYWEVPLANDAVTIILCRNGSMVMSPGYNTTHMPVVSVGKRRAT